MFYNIILFLVIYEYTSQNIFETKCLMCYLLVVPSFELKFMAINKYIFNSSLSYNYCDYILCILFLRRV